MQVSVSFGVILNLTKTFSCNIIMYLNYRKQLVAFCNISGDFTSLTQIYVASDKTFQALADMPNGKGLSNCQEIGIWNPGIGIWSWKQVGSSLVLLQRKTCSFGIKNAAIRKIPLLHLSS